MDFVRLEILDYNNNILARYAGFVIPRIGDKISIENKQGVVKDVIWYFGERKPNDAVVNNQLKCVYIYLDDVQVM